MMKDARASTAGTGSRPVRAIAGWAITAGRLR